MHRFCYHSKREWHAAAQRSVVMGCAGMVATSQPLACLSGYRAMLGGGNAVDAAVAMAATLSVVEPYSVGIGGDCFGLFYRKDQDRLFGMNASGRAPVRADADTLRGLGHAGMPTHGILSVTTPGALAGWADAVARFGRLDLTDALQDAIQYAENGFPVSEVIAGEWAQEEKLLAGHPASAGTYLIAGRAPEPGQVFANPDLAAVYRHICDAGPETFYRGRLASRIAAFSAAEGGLLNEDDLARHRTTWVEPLTMDFRGMTVCELPPNGQGVSALEILNILSGYALDKLRPNGAEYLHLVAEAIKIAFANRDHFLTDADHCRLPLDEVCSAAYGRRARQLIHPRRAMAFPPPGAALNGSDTVYIAAADADGNVASLISSIFMPFGSGMVVPGAGFALHNRGSSFSLDPGHPNCLLPGKRPMHTIIPGMLMNDGQVQMAFGVMGGDMQPQGHAQLLLNLLVHGMNLQEAIDAPRLRLMPDRSIYLEAGIPEAVRDRLTQWGHSLDRSATPVNKVGGGQAIWRDHDEGVWLGASDRRKDGCALGW
ncbi:gamma-glutamyltransferase family protein [Desulfosarcina ovata]|nr:gamma-glutamyltransferase family protein [Desulfosarcina ovata]